jgi:hypothetical protein
VAFVRSFGEESSQSGRSRWKELAQILKEAIQIIATIEASRKQLSACDRSALTAFVDEDEALEHWDEDHALGDKNVVDVPLLVERNRLVPAESERQNAHKGRVHNVRPDRLFVADVGQKVLPAHELELCSGQPGKQS